MDHRKYKEENITGDFLVLSQTETQQIRYKKHEVYKRKNDKLDFIKVAVCFSEDTTVKKMKSQATYWEKIFIKQII